MTEEWKKTLVKATDTIESVIAAIEHGGLRIALVIDDEHHLLGVVTDGDIRRGLLEHIALNKPVQQIMNPQPKVAMADYSRAQLLQLMESEQLIHMPIIDDQRRVIGLETLQNIRAAKKHVNPVFLMAGGFGTRLKPLTDHCPKPMLTVAGKPLLEIILEHLIAHRFSQFYISVHYKADMVMDYFGDGHSWGVTIDYIKEPEPLGTAGSLGLLSKIPEMPMLVMNADLLTKLNFEHLLVYHNNQQALATMAVRQYQLQVPYGTVEIKDQKLQGIVEKPVQTFLMNAGIYVLSPEVIATIKKNVYLDMPSLLNELLAKQQHVSLFPIHEYWSDVGQPHDLEQAKLMADRDFLLTD